MRVDPAASYTEEQTVVFVLDLPHGLAACAIAGQAVEFDARGVECFFAVSNICCNCLARSRLASLNRRTLLRAQRRILVKDLVAIVLRLRFAQLAHHVAHLTAGQIVVGGFIEGARSTAGAADGAAKAQRKPGYDRIGGRPRQPKVCDGLSDF